MRFSRFAIFVVAVLTSTSAHQLHAQVGIVENIRRPVYWKKDARSKAIELDPKRDTGRIVFAGERLRCGRRGRLSLRLYNQSLQLTRSNNWFPIPHLPADQTDPKWQVLKEYNRRGGGERGVTPIYQPASRSKVRPETFQIKWLPKALSRSLTILVREASPSGQEIFRDETVDGRSGHLTAASVRQALLRYRIERGHGPLLVILSSPHEEPERVTFFLLSESEEKSLAGDLDRWNREPEGVWRGLGRAHAFALRDMFTETSEEYEAALKLAPRSVQLLTRAIYAHRRTGNRAREETLARRLPSGKKLP